MKQIYFLQIRKSFPRNLISSRRYSSKAGFGLIEILLVIAVITIVAGIVILAINPNKQPGDTRNVQRRADVSTILNGAYQYTIDSSGTLPASITTIPTEICATGASSCAGLIDLTVLTTSKKYLASIPLEPQKINPSGAGYKISKSANGQITVIAQFPEQGATISATR